MTGVFKANNPSNNAILFLYGIVLKLPVFLHPAFAAPDPQDGALYKSLLDLLSPAITNFPFAISVITFLLLYFQAVGFNRIMNTQRMFRQTNYLTGMTYLLVTSLFPDWFCLSAPLLVNSFLIWIFGRLCALSNEQKPRTAIFNIGLAAGISTFFYLPSSVFLLLIIVGITIARPFRLQEWLTALAGIVAPFYFYVAFVFLFGNISTLHWPRLILTYPKFQSNYLYITVSGLILLTTVAGIYFTNANFRRQVVQTRKSWQLIFLYLFAVCLLPFLNHGLDFTYGILMMIPVSALIAATFYYPEKRMLPLLLHWTFAGFYVYISFFHK